MKSKNISQDKRKRLTLTFWGGPIDGHAIDCPLAPPAHFYLPTKTPLVVTVYSFAQSTHMGLKYCFDGYCDIDFEIANELFDAPEP